MAVQQIVLPKNRIRWVVPPVAGRGGVFGLVILWRGGRRCIGWMSKRSFWRNQPIEPVYPVVYIEGVHVDMVGSDRKVSW